MSARFAESQVMYRVPARRGGGGRSTAKTPTFLRSTAFGLVAAHLWVAEPVASSERPRLPVTTRTVNGISSTVWAEPGLLSRIDAEARAAEDAFQLAMDEDREAYDYIRD